VCGQCHGQWSEREAGTDLTDSPDRYRPGGVLEKQRIYQQFAAADPSRAAADPQKHELMKYLLENDPDYSALVLARRSDPDLGSRVHRA
jgi:hypothetical protein